MVMSSARTSTDYTHTHTLTTLKRTHTHADWLEAGLWRRVPPASFGAYSCSLRRLGIPAVYHDNLDIVLRDTGLFVARQSRRSAVVGVGVFRADGLACRVYVGALLETS